MNKKVIVAGHICLDATPVFMDSGIPFADLLLPGKMLHVGKADIHTGGCVANTGLAMKKLGANVSLMGKVGNDHFGKIVKEILEEYNASEGLVMDSESSTSYSIVLAPPGVDRIFLHNPGANDTFVNDDVDEESLDKADLLHFGYPPLMKKMYENGGCQLEKLMCRAKKKGLATSLDMAAVDPASDAGKVDWIAILSKVLPYVDFFVPSAEELAYMLDRELYEEWQWRAYGGDVTSIIDIEHEIIPLAKKALYMGAKVVLVKCGAKGMYWHTSDEESIKQVGKKIALDAVAWANKSGFERSFMPKRVLSGTGAGDSSIAAFLTTMLEGCSPEECMQLAAATGACCVENYDAISGLASLEELRKRIASGWKKNCDEGN